MNPLLDKNIVHYATLVLEWLDMNAKQHHVARPPVVDLFIDTLQALEQNREQEE